MLAPAAAKAEGFYFGAGVSQYDVEDFDITAFTARAGWRFHPNFAVELEGSTGLDDDAGVDLDSTFGLYGVGVLPVSPEIDLFARVGYQTSEYSIGSTQDGFAGGVGGQWNINQNWGLRAEYTFLDGDDAEANVIGVSAVFKLAH